MDTDAPISVTPVFIHGFLDGAVAWAEVVAALGLRGADAVCVDLPGMGDRADEDGPYSLERFADDVATRVRALKRPVILIGHSMGAQIAELMAGRLGAQVRGLAVLAPVPLRGTQLPDEVMKGFHALGGNPRALRELRLQYSVSLDDARLEKLIHLGGLMKAASIGAIADIWNRGHPSGARHSRYRGPVLIVGGKGDAFVTAEMITESIEPHFDNPTVAFIDEAGHWPHVEQPASVAATLDAFLTGIGLVASTTEPEEL
jgi:pimeloyl-ACP methyl ester carboxylesterase